MARLELPEAAQIVGEDIAFQRRTWRAQRVGWVIMALLVLAAAMGVFGAGPLANGRFRSEDGVLEVEWERVQRAGRDARLVIRSLGAARVTVEGDLVDAFDVVALDPPLMVQGRSPGRLGLAVPTGPDGVGQVSLRTRADAPGIRSATLSDGTRELRLRVVILP